MKKYTIEMRIEALKDISVEANTEQEAIEKAHEILAFKDIILTPEDIQDCDAENVIEQETTQTTLPFVSDEITEQEILDELTQKPNFILNTEVIQTLPNNRLLIKDKDGKVWNVGIEQKTDDGYYIYPIS